MRVTCEERDGILLVHVEGELDMNTAARLRDEVQGQLAGAPAAGLLFDLHRLDFIDSSGVGVLIGCYKRISAEGGRMGFIGLNGTVERVLYLAGILEIAGVFEDQDEAWKKMQEV